MQVRILGPAEVEIDAAVTRISKPKEQILLSMLALHAGETVATSTLVDALWGDDPPTSARRSLRSHLSRLRAAAGADAVATEPDGYRLVVEPADVDALRLAAAGPAAAELLEAGRTEEAHEVLATAAASWRGEPLVGLAEGSAALGERTRLQELRGGVIEQLADVLVALGRPAEAVPDLERAIRLDPLREPLWERLMVALARSGRQSDALRAFQRVRSVLQEEVGIEPGPALVELERRILDQDPTTAHAGPGGAAADGLARAPAPAAAGSEPPQRGSIGEATNLRWTERQRQLPFAGRGEELDQLRRLWESARRGVVTAAVVVGEPGVGKTRLVAELATEVSPGGLVLFGRCDEDLTASYQPFIEALRRFVAKCPDEVLAEVAGALTGELVRLVPELATRLPDLPPALDAEPGTGRLRLFDAVRELLAAVAHRAPVLLVLDDVQWATADTLQLVRHLVVDTDPAPLLVVATCRDTEPDATAARLLADLARAGQRARVELHALDAAGIRALLATAAGHDLPDAAGPFADALLAETGGNTLFLTEVLLHLSESGTLVRRDGAWVGDGPLSTEDLPAELRDVVRRRVDRLPGEVLGLLELAAVIGPAFDTDVLAIIADISPARCDEALAEAVGAGLLVEDPQRFARYRFSHHLVRTVLQEGTTGTRRTRLHWQIGEVLRTGPDGDRERLEEAAFHLCAGSPAGDPVLAAEVAIAAGDATLDALDGAAAIDRYHSALEVLPDDAEAQHHLRALIGIARAEVRRGYERWDAAVDAVDRAVDLALDVDDPDAATRALEVVVGLRSSVLGGPPGLDPLGERLRTRPGLPDELRAAALTAICSAAWSGWARDAERLEEVLAQADELLAGDLDPRARRALLAEVWWLRPTSQADLAAREVAELLELCEQAGTPSARVDALMARLYARTHVLVPELELSTDEARPLVDELRAAAIVLRDPVIAARAEHEAAGNQLDAGDLDGVERRYLTPGVEPLARIAGAVGRGYRAHLIGEVRYHRDDMATLEASTRRLFDGAPHDGQVVGWSGGRAHALVATGRLDEAAAVLDRAVGLLLPPEQARPSELFVLGWLVEAAVAVDHVDALRSLRPYFARWPGRITAAAMAHGTTDLWLAVIDDGLGDVESADRSFAAAEATATRLSLPLWVELTRAFWAESLHRRDAGRAEELALAVLATAEPRGHHAATRRARRAIGT